MKNINLTILALLLSLASFAQVGPITYTTLSICVGDMTTLSCTPPGGSWSSANPSVATVGASNGIVSGVSAGVATITYSAGASGYDVKDVTVNPVPAISCPSSGCRICAGDSIMLTATIAGGTWTSGTTSVATVDPVTGNVIGVSGGMAVVTYMLPTGCYSTVLITVNTPPTLYCVTGGCTFCAGGPGCSIGLSNSQVGVNYQLYNGIGSVGLPVAGTGAALSFGLQTFTGTYYVTATDGITGCTSTTTCNATVTTNPTPAITGGSTGTHVCLGSNITLTASLTGGVWSSANPSIAGVGSAGVVIGMSAGVTTITYTMPTGCYGTITVTVDPLPTTISGSLSVCIGSSTLLSSSPGGGSWSISPVTVATVSVSSGAVTGVSAGTAIVTYTTTAGCSTTAVVTVNPLPTISGTTTICISSSTSLVGSPSGGTWTSGNPSIATVGATSGNVTGVAIGVAMITYTLPTGCYKAVSVNVISAPAPIIGSSGTSGGISICVLSTQTLTSTTPGGVWSSSNPSVATIGSSTGLITGIAVGVTTITYSLGGGCFTTASVTVNPLPAPIMGSNTVCAGFSILLTDASPGGTWTSSGMVASVGPTSGIVTGLVAGMEIITYTLPTGCATTYNVTVNPLPCPSLGVNEQILKHGVELFPNPAYDEITIKMEEGAYSSFVITNNIGQTVSQQTLTKRTTTININTLPAAIYYVTFRGDNGITVKRFVKQ